MKTVIEMAREAGLVGGPVYARGLDRFAELVRADEREACAQSLDKQADLACDAFDRKWAQEMAAAVRARGSNT
jgi:hypothetical protein